MSTDQKSNNFFNKNFRKILIKIGKFNIFDKKFTETWRNSVYRIYEKFFYESLRELKKFIW